MRADSSFSCDCGKMKGIREGVGEFENDMQPPRARGIKGKDGWMDG